jgi:hypothetical protein
MNAKLLAPFSDKVTKKLALIDNKKGAKPAEAPKNNIKRLEEAKIEKPINKPLVIKEPAKVEEKPVATGGLG